MSDEVEVARTGRRDVLKKAAVAGGVVWMTPAVDSFLSAAAAASGSGSASLLKSNNNPPTDTAMCEGTAGTGAGRGSVDFVKTQSSSTVTVTITVTSGPAVNGDGTCDPTTGGRTVNILQADAGGCLSIAPGTPVCFTAANGVPQAFTFALASGATYFAVQMLESGGGGTDTYWSDRVYIP